MFGTLAGTILYKQGTSGVPVQQIQSALNAVMGNNLKVDGKFGPATAAAVEAYQRYVGLKVDGIVGPQTWEALVENHSRENQVATQALVNSQIKPDAFFGSSKTPAYVPTAQAKATYTMAPVPPLTNKIDSIPSPFLSLNQVLKANMPVFQGTQQYPSAIGPQPQYQAVQQYQTAAGPMLPSSSLPNPGIQSMPMMSGSLSPQYEAVSMYSSAIGPMPAPAGDVFGMPWYVWAVVAVGGFIMLDDQPTKGRRKPRRRSARRR